MGFGSTRFSVPPCDRAGKHFVRMREEAAEGKIRRGPVLQGLCCAAGARRQGLILRTTVKVGPVGIVCGKGGIGQVVLVRLIALGACTNIVAARDADADGV